MTTNHTPSKWQLDRNCVYALNEQGYNRFSALIQGGNTAPMEKTTDSELEANASLIAAAPELLDAAQAVLDAFANYERMGEVCPFEGNPMIYASTLVELAELAREAIAKARGSQ